MWSPVATHSGYFFFFFFFRAKLPFDPRLPTRSPKRWNENVPVQTHDTTSRFRSARRSPAQSMKCSSDFPVMAGLFNCCVLCWCPICNSEQCMYYQGWGRKTSRAKLTGFKCFIMLSGCAKLAINYKYWLSPGLMSLLSKAVHNNFAERLRKRYKPVISGDWVSNVYTIVL